MKVKKRQHRMEHQVKAYAFIAPSLLILTVFVFIPLAGAIGISLMNIDIYMKNISFAGIANYIKMFQDERVANATFHTFYFALLEVPLQMIVALLLLMFMLRNTKLHKLLRTVFYLPYVCSMTAVSIMWSMLLNTHYGMLPYLLGKIGITMPNMLSSTTWAMPTVIFVTVWKGFGYTLTILSAAALGVSESLYEAAEIDGCGHFKSFLSIMLPLLWPAMAAQGVFWFLGIWNDYFAPSIYLTRPEVMTLQPLITSLNASQRGTNFPLVMTGAFLSSVPLLAVYLFFQKYFIRALSITSGIK